MKYYIMLFAATLLAACSSEPQKPHTAATKPKIPDSTHITNQATQADGMRPFFNQPAPSVAQTGFLANPNVQAFIQYNVQHNGMSEAELKRFFSQTHHRSSLINTMNKPGTSRPWYEFKVGNSNTAKIKAGRQFYANNRISIDHAARQYGVPAEIIVAIMGIETNYGKNKGSISVADSLATLAFDYPRRGKFFQGELIEFLKMTKEDNLNPFNLTGSFAGAMGLPQFMPSSYRKWAVDANGDGTRNIWSSVPDAAASVASYLKGFGWQTGKRMIIPVSLQITPQLRAIIDEKTALNYTMGELKQLGVIPLEPISNDEHVVLFRLETEPGYYEYFVGLNNFYTIWRYNNSRMYVTAVRDIANGISGGNL